MGRGFGRSRSRGVVGVVGRWVGFGYGSVGASKELKVVRGYGVYIL